jgi:hypothetical protein
MVAMAKKCTSVTITLPHLVLERADMRAIDEGRSRSAMIARLLLIALTNPTIQPKSALQRIPNRVVGVKDL